MADDLTGAVDSASYFHRGNCQVVIDFQRQLKPSIELISNVIQILDTETREGSEEDAYERVLNAAFALAFAESSIGINGKNLIRVYKKVDSTLRGHIGVEIAAAMRGLSRSLAILAPAFPQNGRVVRGGRLYVNGLPVDQTDFANDPNNPIHFSRVSELMSCSGELSAYEIPLSTLRRGAEIILRVILEFEYDAQIRGKRAVIIP
ncbi:MAG: four-carbon acid sugar kinase family protein, partial [Nitrososphaeria archaeon]